MLRDEMELYTKLSGMDGEHTPIGIIGGFLDGYDKGKEDATKWIPCSERLPKKRDWYLGIFKEPDTGFINPLPFICDYLLGMKTKFTTKEGWILKDCTDREEHIDYYFNLECVAWMPLPEPYKGKEELHENK